VPRSIRTRLSRKKKTCIASVISGKVTVGKTTTRELAIRHSQWRNILTAPKTKKFVTAVNVGYLLSDLLALLATKQGNPQEGFMLGGKQGEALNLDYLAKTVIRLALAGSGIEWKAFYACRKGGTTEARRLSEPRAAGRCGTRATATTVQHYVGLGDADTERATSKLY
jgi:hypothetical protein